MKNSNKFNLLISAVFLISTMSCQNKYPELGNGLFAEFATTMGYNGSKASLQKSSFNSS